LILSEEIRIRDVGEATCFGAALNLETWGRGQDINFGQGISNFRKGKSKSRFGQQFECWNYGKTGHFKKNCKELKKKIDNDAVKGILQGLDPCKIPLFFSQNQLKHSYFLYHINHFFK
jgi:hypothetical protein